LFLVACFSLIACLGWVVSPRAYLSSGEGPVADRWSYDKIGAEIILSEPFGVGVGNQLFYTYKSGLFEKYDVNSWGQWQPIHNLYLLVGSETGILGLLAFVVFVYLLIRSGFKEGGGFGGLSPETRTSLVILLALLLFGLFDHFLWDLQLGRLMFWVALGILLGVSTGEKLKSEGG
jgi:O-antigen ligase